MLSPLERMAIEAFREDRMAIRPDTEDQAWVMFALTAALEAGKSLRAESMRVSNGTVETKHDGSPVTNVEREVESMVYRSLERFGLEAATLGEEWGGELPEAGMGVAVDPVDGTWAYMSDTGTSATTIAVFREGRPFLGVVANHSTAEIGYALEGQHARLVRLSCYGEEDMAATLPYENRDPSKVLVNVHPSRKSSVLMTSLQAAWVEGRVRMVRSPGGSPAWALLEAAKGRFTYLNCWSNEPAKPWDLAAGVLLVRSAGGDVVSFDGESIDPVRHAGPFVAGVDRDSIGLVSSIVTGEA